jgi:hypothetical protein
LLDSSQEEEKEPEGTKEGEHNGVNIQEKKRNDAEERRKQKNYRMKKK